MAAYMNVNTTIYSKVFTKSIFKEAPVTTQVDSITSSYLVLSCPQGKTLKGIKTLGHLVQANVHRQSSLPNHPNNFVRDAHWHVPVEPGSDRQNPEQQGGLEFTVYNLQSAIALDTPLFFFVLTQLRPVAMHCWAVA